MLFSTVLKITSQNKLIHHLIFYYIYFMQLSARRKGVHGPCIHVDDRRQAGEVGPFFMWAPGIIFRPSDFSASDFTYWTILLMWSVTFEAGFMRVLTTWTKAKFFGEDVTRMTSDPILDRILVPLWNPMCYISIVHISLSTQMAHWALLIGV